LSSAPRSGQRIETPRETLVVGGGIAGLVVARRLALGGRRVTVLESSDRLGGQLAPQRIAGAVLDAAAESFATRGDAVAGLLTELGLGDDIVTPQPGPAWVLRARGGAVPLPAVGLLGIPADPRAPDVVRAVGRWGALRAQLDELLPPSVGATATTLGELVAARMGRVVLDTLVAPVTRGVYSRDAGELPLEVVAPHLLAALQQHGSLAAAVRALRVAAPAGSLVAGLRGGMFRLADALVAECARLGVGIETGRVVTDFGARHVVVDGVRREGEVVLAGPRPGAESGRDVTLVTLVLDAPELDGSPRGSGLLVAPGAPVAARALTHLTAKWQWVAEALPGRHALRLSYDAAASLPAAPPAAAPPPAIVATALTDASVMFGTKLPDPLDATVGTWSRPAADPRDAGLPRVGEPVAGVGLASVIPHAEAVARQLLSDSRPAAGRGRMEP
jgi:oxygen-dependent protoporphyrinogen oxidase